MSSNETWNSIKRRRRMRAGAFLLVALAALVVVAASLRIERVTTEGSTHYTTAQFEQLLFPSDLDRNLLLFLYRENTGGSIVVPFVDRYTVQMENISSVHVVIYEKQIVGYVDQNGTYMYFDRDGNVVESAKEEMEDVPRIIGLGGEGVRIQVGDKLPVEDPDILKVILSVSQFLQTHTALWGPDEKKLVSIIDQVYVDSRANVTCILGDLQIYLGSGDHMEEKLLLMSDILPKLTARRGTLYLDNYSESAENPSYVFKENVLLLTPGEYDVEAFEADEEEDETMAAEALPAVTEEAEEAGDEEDGLLSDAGDAEAETEAVLEPAETEISVETLREEPETTGEPADGDGVDDIPDDYVGGDGYGH